VAASFRPQLRGLGVRLGLVLGFGLGRVVGVHVLAELGVGQLLGLLLQLVQGHVVVAGLVALLPMQVQHNFAHGAFRRELLELPAVLAGGDALLAQGLGLAENFLRGGEHVHDAILRLLTTFPRSEGRSPYCG